MKRRYYYPLAAGAMLAGVLLAPLVQSEYLRWHYTEQLARYATRVRPPVALFVGDSNTAAGRAWGRRLWGIGGTLEARNLGVSGYTVEQVCIAARGAIEPGGPAVVMMCGTNDVFVRRCEPDHWRNARADVATVIDKAKAAAVRLIVMQPPALGPCDDQWERRNALLVEWRAALRALCADTATPLVDVNPVIAPSGELLRAYHAGDAVHLNSAALDLYAAELRQLLPR